MITLWSILVGFLSSALPEGMKIYRDKQDKRHELELMKLQMQWNQKNQDHQLNAIDMQAQAEATKALYAHAAPTGVRWTDALAGSVRPIITYAFFITYACVKYAQWMTVIRALGAMVTLDSGLTALISIWSPEDQGLFAAVMSFWFGQRALMRRGR